MRYLVPLAAVVAAQLLTGSAVQAQSDPTALPSYDQLVTPVQHEQPQYTESVYTPGEVIGGRYYGMVEAVVVRPIYESNNAFTAQLEGDVPSVQEFDEDQTLSNRFEFGYLADPCTMGWRARYWHLDTISETVGGGDANNLIADDAIVVSAGAFVEDVDSVAVAYELQADVIDLEGTRSTGGNSLVSGGLRLARFDQNYRLFSDAGNFNQNLETLAIGPTVGFDWEYALGGSGLSAFSKLRGSLLYSHKDTETTGAAGGALVVPFSADESDLMLNGEAQLGLKYRRGRFFVQAAAEYQYWSDMGNVMNTNTQVASDDASNDRNLDLDEALGFFGFNVGLGFEF